MYSIKINFMFYKKIFSFIFLVIFCNAVFAQDNDSNQLVPKNNSFTISLFPIFVNTFQMNFERTFGNFKNGIQISPFVTLKGDKNSDYQKTGFGGEIQYKIYLLNYIRNKASKNSTIVSLYMGPFIRYLSQEEKEEIYEVDYSNNYPYTASVVDSGTFTTTISSTSGGVVFGLKLSLGNTFIIEPFFGAGIMYSDKITNPKRQTTTTTRRSSSLTPNFADFQPGNTGIFVRIGFQFGVRF